MIITALIQATNAHSMYERKHQVEVIRRIDRYPFRHPICLAEGDERMGKRFPLLQQLHGQLALLLGPESLHGLLA